MFPDPLVQVKKKKYIDNVPLHSADLKAPREPRNPPVKAAPGKFRGSGRHNVCNFLQDLAIFTNPGHGISSLFLTL